MVEGLVKAMQSPLPASMALRRPRSKFSGTTGLICRDYIDARACLFQCFRKCSRPTNARQRDVRPAQMFFAAGKLAERGKHPSAVDCEGMRSTWTCAS